MILVDTNVLVAAGNASETDHVAAASLLSSTSHELLLSPMALAEVCHLVGTRDGGGARAEALLLDDIAAGGITLAELTTPDVERMAHLVREHADLGLGATDASIIALAERLGADSIATFDRRHFTVVRSVTGEAFTLLP